MKRPQPSQFPRRPAGTPAGGQFAATVNPEADLELRPFGERRGEWGRTRLAELVDEYDNLDSFDNSEHMAEMLGAFVEAARAADHEPDSPTDSIERIASTDPALDGLADDDRRSIAAFLVDGGYESVNDWMADSDYEREPDGSWTYEGHPVDPVQAITGAVEATGPDAVVVEAVEIESFVARFADPGTDTAGEQDLGRRYAERMGRRLEPLTAEDEQTLRELLAARREAPVTIDEVRSFLASEGHETVGSWMIEAGYNSRGDGTYLDPVYGHQVDPDETIVQAVLDARASEAT